MRCTRPLACVKDYNDINPKTGHATMKFNGGLVSSVHQLLIKECNNDVKKLKVLYGYDYLEVPCGKCPSCRSNWCRDWSIRAYHESLLYSSNVFLTLTYEEKNLPNIYIDDGDRSPKDDYVKFMKRFRMNLLRELGQKVRFFHVFEYGSSFKRPHHHAIIFNTSLPDKTLWKVKGGFPIYRSPILEKSWTYGFSTVQNVTYEVCAYVARYCMKKVDVDSDFYDGRVSEFNLKSRMPGLGNGWFQKFKDDVYNNDELVIKNYVTRPPRYYDNLYDNINSPRMEVIKNARKEYAVKNSSLDTPERLVQIEAYQKVKISRMKRDYEQGKELKDVINTQSMENIERNA